MTLFALVVRIAVVVTAMIALTAVVVIGHRENRLEGLDVRHRARVAVPSLGLLGGVLAVNTVARRVAPDVSWLIGWNVTGAIYAFEGTFVAWVQSFASTPATAYFAFIYVYGYVFLLVFPLVAYAVLEDPDPLRETAMAYSLNYAIGLACYVLFVAYGPRNLIPGLVDPLLYTSWPETQLLVSEVNRNTNVFPSLHASLSVTVALLAYRTRYRYPRWLPLAIFVAASVVVSTMYLGIHWGIDVLAGGLLAALSVVIAAKVTRSEG
jgi:membrane-associated phospholipid phosphatase